MAETTTKKKRYIIDDKVNMQDKSSDLLMIADRLNNDDKIKNKTHIKLNEIEEEMRLLFDKKISYKNITKALNEAYGLKLKESVIKSYYNNVLILKRRVKKIEVSKNEL